MVTAVLLDAVPDETTYPANWEHSTTTGAGTVELGRQRHPDWHNGPNLQPYLRVANVFEDRIDTSDVMEMHWPDGVFERFQLRVGDVLLNEGQSPEYLGRPAIYRGEPPDTAFTNSLIRFQANERVLPEFALLVFRRHMRAGRFKRESRITTNIAHLSAARLKQVEFPIPPLDEQRQIVSATRDRLDGVKRLATDIASSSVGLDAMRRSLLAAAFRGDLTSGFRRSA
jgi:type I restriction enzyme S subunit